MFQEITTKNLNKNAFQMIGSDWLLVTAEKDGKANTMTASWGGIGVMWGKDVACIVIRPQRYTKEFIDGSDTLSISVLPEGNKDIYGYLGKVSGRDEDKIAKSGLSLAHDSGIPYFEEAETVLLCRKLFAQDMKPEAFLDPSIPDKWYPQKDYHTMYICEIEKILIKA